jgi:pentapeptide MXKDX repeat protein
MLGWHRNKEHGSMMSRIVTLAAATAFGLTFGTAVMAQSKMSDDKGKMSDTMSKDKMSKDNMAKDAMSKDKMSKDNMSKDNMSKDKMSK